MLRENVDAEEAAKNIGNGVHSIEAVCSAIYVACKYMKVSFKSFRCATDF